MSRASRLIEKLDGAVRPNNAAEHDDWEYAVSKPVDKEPTSWRSIIDPPKVISTRPNTGRGHRGK